MSMMLKPTFRQISREKDVVSEDNLLKTILEEAREKATESVPEGTVKKKTLKQILFGGE